MLPRKPVIQQGGLPRRDTVALHIWAIVLTRGGGAFFVMKEFGSGGFTAAVAATNGLIGQLAPR
jgi:hypothetical protein